MRNGNGWPAEDSILTAALPDRPRRDGRRPTGGPGREGGDVRVALGAHLQGVGSHRGPIPRLRSAPCPARRAPAGAAARTGWVIPLASGRRARQIAGTDACGAAGRPAPEGCARGAGRADPLAERPVRPEGARRTANPTVRGTAAFDTGPHHLT
ncbi:hypothetical protein GALLR39Z86_02280 [Glycomyces algeriensis]|uniref:Uncharacterized protein n=1 Tax=Glycomyces algeriensis TaxID=256037 RepID=A0A9W6LE60_9ACTN|nr:hypothetical protein GALLR39Z86_02280 [Glycomyces algeriensis]